MLTHERLLRVLSYESATGLFRRRIGGTTIRAGEIAGYIDAKGYRSIAVDGHPYKAHRLVWFYVTGIMPIEYIDHINGDKSDNRFRNLRLATNSQNQANRGLSRVNTSGITGIRFQEDRQKWVAMITIRGKQTNLGRFTTKEEAVAAYQTARNNAWGEFVRGASVRRNLPPPIGNEPGAVHHPEVTAELLRTMFSYDPDTGRFTRLKGRQGHARAGDLAGRVEWTGQRGIKIMGKRYAEHRLAWLYVKGRLPVGEIDHINGNPGDNRIVNLRESSRSQNLHNTRGHSDSIVGLKGVSFDDRCVRKFYARIKIDGKVVNLGHFLTAEDAAAAYNDAARAAFGEFAKPPLE